MTTVLDAWAVLALYEGHPSAGRVAEVLEEGDAIISAINLGEVLYQLEREHGSSRATELVDRLRDVATVEDATWEVVAAVAHVKARGGLSYADAFCVATAQRHDAPLCTGDPEILALGSLAKMIDLRA